MSNHPVYPATHMLVWVIDPVSGQRHTALVLWFDEKKHERFIW